MKFIMLTVLFCLSQYLCNTATILTSDDINPEIYMNVTQMIQHFGYPCETHQIVTEDGYILIIHRIPHGKNNTSVGKKPVVFLQHGLLDSSFTWVNNPPNESLGYILADLGYDVWMGNSRGNEYSKHHITLPNTSRAFWAFSWDEMVLYDLPASIDYVLDITGSAKLSYVGHSQGSEIGFALLSENGPLNAKISSFVALAPIAYLGHLRTAIKYLARLAGGLDLIFQLFDHGEFLPSGKIIDLIAKYVCGHSDRYLVCSNILFLITGYDCSNLNYSRLPVYLSHTPAGTSVKNMVHYAQGYESNKFQMYDYGLIGNLYYYHQMHPPTYGLKTFGVPVALFYGGNDWLADPTDVSRLIAELETDAAMFRLIPQYNHLDFVWGENVATVVYKDLVQFLRMYQ